MAFAESRRTISGTTQEVCARLVNLFILEREMSPGALFLRSFSPHGIAQPLEKIEQIRALKMHFYMITYFPEGVT